MCCVELGVHIQAFTFSSQDHGRLSDKHNIQAFTLKTLSRSRSVEWRAHIRAFIKNSQDHGRLSGAWCGVCGGVLCCVCGGVVCGV